MAFLQPGARRHSCSPHHRMFIWVEIYHPRDITLDELRPISDRVLFSSEGNGPAWLSLNLAD